MPAFLFHVSGFDKPCCDGGTDTTLTRQKETLLVTQKADPGVFLKFPLTLSGHVAVITRQRMFSEENLGAQILFRAQVWWN